MTNRHLRGHKHHDGAAALTQQYFSPPSTVAKFRGISSNVVDTFRSWLHFLFLVNFGIRALRSMTLWTTVQRAKPQLCQSSLPESFVESTKVIAANERL